MATELRLLKMNVNIHDKQYLIDDLNRQGRHNALSGMTFWLPMIGGRTEGADRHFDRVVGVVARRHASALPSHSMKQQLSEVELAHFDALDESSPLLAIFTATQSRFGFLELQDDLRKPSSSVH